MAYKLTENQIRTVVENGSRRLANYCMNGNLRYVVTGSSGGLDSAVTLALAQRACHIAQANGRRLTSVALVLPCESDPEDTEKGILVAKRFGARMIPLDLESTFQCYMAEIIKPLDGNIAAILRETIGREELIDWGQSKRVAQGNIKARLRMISVYHTARMLKGMVLSTDNLSEFWMAFWTICGDVGDFNMIQNIMKGKELYDIARFLGVPESIITTKPHDGLNIAGAAEDQLGADYQTIDAIMIGLIQRGFNSDGSYAQLNNLPSLEGIDPGLVAKIALRCLNGAYKRYGTTVISREELGLPAIKDIRL